MKKRTLLLATLSVLSLTHATDKKTKTTKKGYVSLPMNDTEQDTNRVPADIRNQRRQQRLRKAATLLATCLCWCPCKTIRSACNN